MVIIFGQNNYKHMKTFENFINEGVEKNYEEILSKVQSALPELSELINHKLGFSPKLDAQLSNKRVRIVGTEDLMEQLGDTLVKTLFSKISIYFCGGDVLDDGKQVWFNPNVSYEHPSGGSNGTKFIWDSLWFDLEKNEWIEGRVIFLK